MSEIYYELMDTDTANVVGFYDRKEDALAIVRRAYDLYGLPGIEGLALSEEPEQGEGVLLGEGAELLGLAMATVPSRVAG